MLIQISIIFFNFSFGLFAIFGRSGINKYFLNPANSFWVIFIYFAAIQPLIRISDYNAGFYENNVTIALLAFSFSAIFLYLGNRLSLGAKLARSLPALSAASSDRLDLLAQLLLISGVSLTLLLIQAYGGWAEYFQRTHLRILEIDVSDYLTLGPRICIFAMLIGLSSAVYQQRKLATLSYCILGIGLLMWFTYHGSRSSTILVAIVLFGSFYASRMRTPNFMVFSLFALGLTLVIGFIGAYRAVFSDFAMNTKGLTLADFIANSLGFLLRSGDTGFSEVSINEDFGMAAAAVRYIPYEVPHHYGYSFLQLFTQWIPRSVWPGKFYPSGELWDVFHRTANTSLYVNSAGLVSGPAPTIVGSYYYAAGFFGVIIGSFLSGIMLKIFWAYSLGLPPNVRTIFIIAIAPIGYMEANNPTLWITFWLPSAGISLAMVFLIARTRRKIRITR